MNIAMNEYYQKTQLMVSTDLDGTLLDHHNYSWAPVKPALSRLNALGIPVIINTSKTAEEVIVLQQEMGLTAPFIIENGSALLLPKCIYKSPPEGVLDCGDYWKKVFGSSRLLIVEVLKKLRKRFDWNFVGFSDWDESEVMAQTGLDKKGAHLALQRGFSEPIIWGDSKSAFELFTREISKYQLQIREGGRFTHILGATDKSVPLQWLNEYYQKYDNQKVEWIVLGDSANDIDMLKIADYPVAVKSPVRDYPVFSGIGNTVFTNELGPVGWNQAILELLKTYTNK